MNRFSRVAAGFALMLMASAASVADEGMWPFNLVPLERIKAKYGVEVSDSFLEHLRLSSVGTGGASASFVSRDGLVLTNEHVASGCLYNLSTAGKDYIKNGFHAPTRAQEPKCPGMEFTSLLAITDVTQAVQGAGKGLEAAAAAAAQRQTMARLEKECSAGLQAIRCETVTLYSGALYHLYKYRKHSDIRLVMAPELSIAYFGGDTDNFTYPRYALDIAFFRIYENDRPLQVDHYLTVSVAPVKENDLVFISGSPGSTLRLQTVAQLEFLRDYAHPFRIETLGRTIARLQEFSAKSAENARVADRALVIAQNTYKGTSGSLAGLRNPALMAKKIAAEKALREAVRADPKMNELYGGAWDTIAAAVAWQRENYLRYNFTEGAMPGRLAQLARTLVRASEEKAKPNEERLPAFQDQRLPTLEQQLFSNAPIFKALDVLQVMVALEDLQRLLPKDDPLVKSILAGKAPAARAAELIEGTTLDDIAVRKTLYSGGKSAIAASSDPLIVLMRTIEPTVREIRKQYEDRVDALTRRNGALIAQARFALYGSMASPDATGTLRLSYGQVKGYTENGKPIPFRTTLGETFSYAERHGNEGAHALPPTWMRARPRLRGDTSFNSVSTADITGGNSGSPVVNAAGELVGILFDGNIHSLSWSVLYDDVQGRAVSTDATAIVETLRKVYDAAPLADELVNARASVKVSASFPKGRSTQPLDGRLLLLLSTNPAAEPRRQIGLSEETQLVFGVDVDGMRPGQPVTIDDAAIGYPIRNLRDLRPGEYYVQVLLHRYETFHRSDGHIVKLPMDRGEGQQWNDAPGNLYSTPRKVTIGTAPQELQVVLDQQIPAIEPPKDSKYIRHIRIQSQLLTKFWGRPMYLGAAVLVPEGFDEHPRSRYPLMIYENHFVETIEGFRTEPPDPDLKPDYSKRFRVSGYNRIEQEEAYEFYQQWVAPGFPRYLVVMLQHANPYYDDSYRVNSANLGPYGDAIETELIPAIEKKFRAIGAGWARFVYGGSTGGWEAFAAQVFYPDRYNGAFIACPDPVDFRAFMHINLYEDRNAFYQEGPHARIAQPGMRDYKGRTIVSAQAMNQYELALGSRGRSGRQFDIWQAVFSPVGPDGYPAPIFDKETGEIDASVAAYWKEHYDLSDILQRNWPTLGPKLRGKLHLYCGRADNFFLNNAVYLVEDFLQSTTNPPYDGEVKYGDRAEHCWNGDPSLPNHLSRLHYNVQYLPRILDRIAKTAPPGADLTSWRY